MDKARDVGGLYLRPPDRAPVICVDEKLQIQALERTAPVLPLRPGQPGRLTHDYQRHCTLDLFAALDGKADMVIGSCQERRRGQEFRAFLNAIDVRVPASVEVHFILDNAAIHKTELVGDWLRHSPRFHLHFTLTSPPWLDLVECWFALLTRRRLKRGVFRGTIELEKAIRTYIKENNRQPKPSIWTKAADAILANVGRFCIRTLNSDH